MPPSIEAGIVKPSMPIKTGYAHPLDPLSAAEMSTVARALKLHCLQTEKGIQAVKFLTITLKEPAKEDVIAALGIPTQPLAFGQAPPAPSGKPIERQAYAIVLDNLGGHAYEAEVTIGAESKVDSFTLLPDDVHPGISVEELLDAEKVVKNDPEVQKICAELGLKMEEVCCDGWSSGLDDRWPANLRLQQCLMFGRPHGPDSNLYAHPLDFTPVIDSNAGKVIRIDWARPRLPGVKTGTEPHAIDSPTGPDGWARSGYPNGACEYLPELLEKEGFKYRDDIKPIEITQPEGVSFTLQGNRLSWQKWDMHIGFNYREGLVINTVTYTDTDVGKGVAPTVRPLFYRLSVAEMVVPYLDPSYPHSRKMAFDVGEYGLGMMANSLELGCDCKGAISYIDAELPTHSGEAMNIKNAICIHEEDAGLSWKHTDYRTQKAHAVRGRKLVVSFVCTLANYEYGFYFNFYQDGNVELEVKLTGILNLYHLAEGEKPDPHGVQVAPRINAHYHQHIFSLRVDAMIDGLNNSLVQSDWALLDEPSGSAGNYYGNACVVKKTTFKKAGFADYDNSTGRGWTITNSDRKHYSSGHDSGYKIMCSNYGPLLAKPDSVVALRAPFATHSMWVVPFADDKVYPAGQHVPQTHKAPEDSLVGWVVKGGNVENTDIVTYVTITVNHNPRPEDFPVMPVETAKVMFKPVSFFKQNPALDVPAEKDKKSVMAKTNGVNGSSNGNGASACCS